MIELLLYVSTLTHAPTGEGITPSQKLALYEIILSGNGEAVSIDAATFCPRIRLTHVKSLPRLLRSLADSGLIRIELTRSDKGQRAASRVYPLPGIKRDPSNLQVTRDAPSNLQVTRDQDPSNLQVTRDSPSNLQVTRLNDGNNKDLADPSNLQVTRDHGIGLAFKSPSPDLLNKGGERADPSNLQVTRLLDHPAVKVWLDLTKEDISVDAAKLIVSKVAYPDLWKETLVGWLASRWAKTNIAGQIERYTKQLRDYTPPPTEAKSKDPNKEKELRDIMYADE
jgi:hypothetical protein